MVFKGVRVLPHVAVGLWLRQVEEFRNAMADTEGERGELIRDIRAGVGTGHKEELRKGTATGEEIGLGGRWGGSE